MVAGVVCGVGARVELGGMVVGAVCGVGARVELGGMVAGVVCGARVGARVGLGTSTAWVHPATASRTKRPIFKSGFKTFFFHPRGRATWAILAGTLIVI